MPGGANGDSPVTRAELRVELQVHDERILAAMQDLENRMQEFVRDAQTEILRGFDRYNRSLNARVVALTATGVTTTSGSRPSKIDSSKLKSVS